MAGMNRSKLVRITVRNIGCIGNDGVEIELDNVVCLVGRNNAGKSTILRAYELAKGSATFDIAKDRCQYAPGDQPSEVLLEVHIPEGIGNVDAKWKTEKDGLLIVKSRWQWASPSFLKVRTTWDPTGGPDGVGAWADEGKAGGADPVFNSRLALISWLICHVYCASDHWMMQGRQRTCCLRSRWGHCCQALRRSVSIPTPTSPNRSPVCLSA